MSKPKALILSTVASVIDQFNRNNIDILQNLNFEITIIANFKTGNATSIGQTNKFKDYLLSQNIEVIDISIPRNFNPVLLLQSYFKIKQLIKSEYYSLIHCHTPIASMLLRIIYLFKTGIKKEYIIYTAHGFHFYKGAPIINWLLYYPVEKLLSRFTDCLITINREDFKRVNKSFKEIPNLLHLNGVGINTKRFSPLSKDEKLIYRKKYGYSEKDIIIISVGEFNRNKNQILLVEAIKIVVKKNKNIKVLFVGIGSELEKNKSAISKYSLANFIFFLGYRNDIDKLLKISDIFISCSRREGLPVSIIEAMATGLSVIATNNRGHKDLVKDGENGFLVPDNDPLYLSYKIEELMNSKEIVEKFSFNNRKGINKYSEEKINVQMMKIFSQVMLNCL